MGRHGRRAGLCPTSLRTVPYRQQAVGELDSHEMVETGTEPSPLRSSVGPAAIGDCIMGDIVVVVEGSKAASKPRPKTCGQLASQGGLGEAGCKRLPRHNGDHRSQLHRLAPVKTAKAKPRKAAKRLSAAARRDALAAIAVRLEAGELTAGEALAAAAKLA